MKTFTLALVALSLPAALQAAPDLEEAADMAISGDTIAWDFVEWITTEVGPRQAGTEARARDWAKAWLRKHEFQNAAVWTTVTGILANEGRSIQTGEPIPRARHQ